MARSGKRSNEKNRGSKKERQEKEFQNNNNKKDNKKPSIALSEYINGIYENYVNLKTVCSHNCECCKISMPGIHYSEFVNIVTDIWNTYPDEEKLNLIFMSIEYFFRYDYNKWGMDSLIKPCMLLDKDGLCKIYSKRPLNCRMYGLWPKENYEARVDKFEKAYSSLGLKREDLPLNTQCPHVKRVDDSIPITTELIEDLFSKLDEMDKKIGDFSSLQVAQKENYRTFADWLLFKIFGPDWLAKLTSFAMAADKNTMEEQIKAIKEVFTKEFSKTGIPDVRKRL